MKTKNLPTIIITGTTQQLVEIEIILIWLGYYRDEDKWNNKWIRENEKVYIKCIHDEGLLYLCRPQNNLYIQYFRADQVQEIINYVTTYKNGN